MISVNFSGQDDVIQNGQRHPQQTHSTSESTLVQEMAWCLTAQAIS